MHNLHSNQVAGPPIAQQGWERCGREGGGTERGIEGGHGEGGGMGGGKKGSKRENHGLFISLRLKIGLEYGSFGYFAENSLAG